MSMLKFKCDDEKGINWENRANIIVLTSMMADMSKEEATK